MGIRGSGASRWRGARVMIADLDADGAEAVRRLMVEDFPVVVVNGLHGGDLYREGRERWRSEARMGESL